MRNGSQARRAAIWTVGGFLGYFLFGIVDSLKGPALGPLMAELDFNFSHGGMLVMGAYFGLMLASVAIGLLSDLYGRKAVMILSAALVFAGVSGFASSSFFPLMFAMFLLAGFGCGGLQVAGGGVVSDLNPGRQGQRLNFLACFYAVGAMIGPYYAGRLLEAGVSWRNVYCYVLPLAGGIALYYLLARYPGGMAATASGMDFKSLGGRAFSPRMRWMYAENFLYVCIEVTMATWMVEFLGKVRGIDVQTGALALSIFFGLLVAGRFIGSLFVDRLGLLRCMAVAAALAAACALAGVYGPGFCAWLLPATGLFLSIIFPSSVAVVSSMHDRNRGAILGLFFACGGLGGMFGPWAVGVASDWLGLRHGVGVMSALFCALLMAALAKASRFPADRPE